QGVEFVARHRSGQDDAAGPRHARTRREKVTGFVLMAHPVEVRIAVLVDLFQRLLVGERHDVHDRVSVLSAAVQPRHLRFASVSSVWRVRWRPSASKLPGSSHVRNASRSGGHSLSTTAYQAVSRLRFLYTVAWWNMPSYENPSRCAARREAALRASHFHS